MAGKLYGIGVGPGDPELLTLKAARIIKEADIIAVPGKLPEESVAYKIVKGIIPEICDKELIAIEMPMTKDIKLLKESHERAADIVKKHIKENKDVAFLTLGDPSIYSTYMYVHKIISKEGFSVEMISGIPSFCAAAAKLGISLGEKNDEIHIIPASYKIDEALKLSGTKVLMKAGRSIKSVKKHLENSSDNVVMVENCGMPGEKIYKGAENIPDDAGYYSLIIVR